jgi:hypothetical protein
MLRAAMEVLESRFPENSPISQHLHHISSPQERKSCDDALSCQQLLRTPSLNQKFGEEQILDGFLHLFLFEDFIELGD